METTKCPVCGRTGIPDYLINENVVCPNCNSELGVYRTLHALAEGNSGSSSQTRKYKMLSIVLSILAVLLIGALMLFNRGKSTNELEQKLADANTVVTELRDSISNLKSQIESSKTTDLPSASQYIEYTVMPNDSPWRIVRKFYGNHQDWENISRKIAEANGIWDENAATWKQIHPGQVIRIHNIK